MSEESKLNSDTVTLRAGDHALVPSSPNATLPPSNMVDC